MLIKVNLPSQEVISVDLSSDTTVTSLLGLICQLRNYDEKWLETNRLQLWESVLIHSSPQLDYQETSHSGTCSTNM